MKQQDTYKEVRIFQSERITARVFIPDLTPEERERRLKEIGKAAARLFMSKNEQEDE